MKLPNGNEQLRGKADSWRSLKKTVLLISLCLFFWMGGIFDIEPAIGQQKVCFLPDSRPWYIKNHLWLSVPYAIALLLSYAIFRFQRPEKERKARKWFVIVFLIAVICTVNANRLKPYISEYKWFRYQVSQAEKGDGGHQARIAKIYLTGTYYALRDYEAAYFWASLAHNYRPNKATAQVRIDASSNLSSETVHEIDVQVEEWVPQENLRDEKFPELLRLAEGGDAKAQNALGKYYRYRQIKGGKRQFDEAHKWFHKALENGDKKANYYIGDMYSEGQGVPENKAEALYYFSLVEDHGISAPFVWKMQPEEIIEARKLLLQRGYEDEGLIKILQKAFNPKVTPKPVSGTWSREYLCNSYPKLCAIKEVPEIIPQAKETPAWPDQIQGSPRPE